VGRWRECDDVVDVDATGAKVLPTQPIQWHELGVLPKNCDGWGDVDGPNTVRYWIVVRMGTQAAGSYTIVPPLLVLRMGILANACGVNICATVYQITTIGRIFARVSQYSATTRGPRNL
jgi:hypothetical protein